VTPAIAVFFDEMSPIGFERSMKLHRDRFLEIVRKPLDSSEAANLTVRFAVVDVTDGSFSIYSIDEQFRNTPNQHVSTVRNLTLVVVNTVVGLVRGFSR